MAQYRFGLIFNLDRHLKQNDPTAMFAGVDQRRMLQEIVRFLTEDIKTPAEGREMCNEVEFLMGVLHHQEIIDDYMFDMDEPYVKICAILFAICESIMEMFIDTRFYEYLKETNDIPKVIPISRANFAIVVKHPLRRHDTQLYNSTKAKLRSLRKRD